MTPWPIPDLCDGVPVSEVSIRWGPIQFFAGIKDERDLNKRCAWTLSRTGPLAEGILTRVMLADGATPDIATAIEQGRQAAQGVGGPVAEKPRPSVQEGLFG